MSIDLEGFTVHRKQVNTSGEPGRVVVTIGQGHQISMNKAARLALGSPRFVSYLFNDGVVVIKREEVKGPTAYSVSVRGVATGKGFVKSNGLQRKAGHRFDAVADGDMLVFDTNKPGKPTPLYQA